MCWKYAKGSCEKGESCPYLHVSSSEAKRAKITIPQKKVAAAKKGKPPGSEPDSEPGASAKQKANAVPTAGAVIRNNPDVTKGSVDAQSVAAKAFAAQLTE